MQTVLTITEIENAINTWRDRRPAKNGVLCREASVLADVYGEMIYLKQNEKLVSEFTEEQIQLIELHA